MSAGRLDPDGFATAVEDGIRWSYGTTAEMLRAIWNPDIDEGLLVVASPTALARIEGGAIRYEGQRLDDDEVGRIFVGEPIGAGLAPGDPVDLIAASGSLVEARPILESSRYKTVVAILGLDEEGEGTSDLKSACIAAMSAFRTLKGQGDLYLFGPLEMLYEPIAFDLRVDLLQTAQHQGWLSELVVYPFVRHSGWEWDEGVLRLAAMIHLRKLEVPDPEPTRYVYFDGNSADDFDDFYDDFAALVGAGLVNLDWVRFVELGDAKDWSPTHLWFSAERSAAFPNAETERHRPLERELGVEIHSHLQMIERGLFSAVIGYLKHVHGDAWWREGVPEGTRKAAASKQEMSIADAPREAYLDLSDLLGLLASNWKALKRFLPELSQLGTDRMRKEFEFARLLDVRNRDSHSPRLEHHPFTATDLEFLVSTNGWVRKLADGVTNDLPLSD